MVESDSNTASNNGIANIASPFLFADTVHRLLSAFADHGIKVFVTIDQQTEASAAGLGLPPTTLIVFGNPKAGTPLMLARRASGIDLPLKVLVVEAVPGQVTVIFNAGYTSSTATRFPRSWPRTLLRSISSL